MLEITLQAHLPSIEKLKNFVKDIRQNIIKTGLDKTLNEQVKQLKEELRRILDSKTQKVDNEQLELEQAEKDIRYSGSEEVVLEYLTGANFSKHNKAQTFSELIDSKLAVVNYFKKGTPNEYMGVKFRTKTKTGDFDYDYNRLGESLKEATFLFIDSNGNKKYYKNPGLNLQKFLKVVCTTDTGVTDKARKRYDHWLDTKGYVEWSLTEAGVKYIKRNCPDITPMMYFSAQGNFDRAIESLHTNSKNIQQLQKLQELETKLVNLRDRKNLPKSAEIFSSVLTLINNLKIIKEFNTDKILNYRLVSNYSAESDNKEFLSFYEEFDRQVRTWIAFNSMPWFLEIVKKTEQLIKQYES
jgi:hypothetical protein